MRLAAQNVVQCQLSVNTLIMAGSAYWHSPPLSLIADFNHAITYLFSHVLRNYIFHNLIVGQLASPIDLLTKRHQAERHAGIA